MVDFHARVVLGDRQALDQLIERVFPLLKIKLRRLAWSADGDQIFDAAEGAVLEYAAHPGRFDPTRGMSLEGLLLCSARRNLLNLLQAEQRRRARELRYAEHLRQTRGHRTVPLTLATVRVRSWLLSVAVDQTELEALRSWLDGDASAVTLAATLGLLHLPQSQQRKAIKQFKDRVVRRLRRKAARERRKENQ